MSPQPDRGPRRTVVAFHAHPDDEALLTAGTMATVAAQGHRVVLVVATDGSLGLAGEDFGAKGGELALTRSAEVEASARALGVARVESLGYADSGSGPELSPDPPGRVRFARADLDEAAARLAEILLAERADLLLTYDRNGGYGHRDHVRVHEVGAAAADRVRAASGRPLRVLEATVPRDLICRALDLVARVYRFPPEFHRSSFDRAFSAGGEITHRIPVHRQIRAKRTSMRAHASQASGGDVRTLAMLLRIPRPLFDLVFGWEWYREAGSAGGSRLTDVFEAAR
ncbi:PIG-L family deacetylase [Marihabitans asiaticum]|uniref:LmbE family N-acetylglucosaminyl deacetylase n=1 Tax=Marihabitans asiaticum TaxID=415218 RepID=A0A560WDA4_9MICO|nr:PIG-L family deacetylase [Marihabitans asiaticum]TWD15540.1 LmbE family N-acetylglucosaminyl deacetylase [Marihabitans asiaticum]